VVMGIEVEVVLVVIDEAGTELVDEVVEELEGDERTT